MKTKRTNGFGCLVPFQLLNEMTKNIRDKSDVECKFYETAEDVPDPRVLSSGKRMYWYLTICYFRNKTTGNRFMSEEDTATLIVLFSSNYFKLSRQTIRENANFICLFPQDLKNLNPIFDDDVGSDMTKEEFRQLYKTAWKKQHGFVIIDLSSKKHDDKYRSGLDEFYIPN